MQMNALRSANFLKLSSNSSTSDEYWVTSISAGTPAGYCLSQIRSMVFPLWLVPDFSRILGRDAVFLAVLRMPLPMASGCVLSTHWESNGKCHEGAGKPLM